MRTQKNINLEIISWSNTKFSDTTSQELYDRQWGEELTVTDEEEESN